MLCTLATLCHPICAVSSPRGTGNRRKNIVPTNGILTAHVATRSRCVYLAFSCIISCSSWTTCMSCDLLGCRILRLLLLRHLRGALGLRLFIMLEAFLKHILLLGVTLALIQCGHECLFMVEAVRTRLAFAIFDGVV